MKFVHKVAALIMFVAVQLPCAVNAAEEDKELALIAAEQEKSPEDEQLDDINPALTESISTERTQETDKEIKERKKKLKQMRKEKERDNERKLKESSRNKNAQRREEQTVIIDPEPQPVEPEPIKPEPIPKPVKPEPNPEPVKPEIIEPPTVETITPEVPITPQTITPPTQTPTPQQPPISNPSITPPPTTTIAMPDQKAIYANFAEVARAVHFTPLYMPRKSGYEITSIYAQPGIVEVRYGRRWEPSVSLAVRTHKRTDGEELRDISGVTGVKWRVDTTTGTTLYIAKISETQHVAAWAVGHYTFSAQAENLSFAGFHSLVADELIELSTHYYLDL